jgi:hypothetical protein
MVHFLLGGGKHGPFNSYLYINLCQLSILKNGAYIKLERIILKQIKKRRKKKICHKYYSLFVSIWSLYTHINPSLGLLWSSHSNFNKILFIFIAMTFNSTPWFYFPFIRYKWLHTKAFYICIFSHFFYSFIYVLPSLCFFLKSKILI